MLRRSLRVLVSVLVFSFAVRALFAERELEFAKGLQSLQLYDLCFEQFQKVLADKALNEDQRMEAELAFADAYMAAADHAEKLQLKDQYLDLAAKQLDAFLKNHADVPEANNVRYNKAMIQQARASERSNSLGNMRDKANAQTVSAEADKLFADAISQFDNAATTCKAEMEKISGIARDERLQAKRGAMLEMFLKTTNQSAWTHFYWAEMYHHTIISDPAKEKEHLDQAIGMFKKYVDDYGNFVISLSGRIGMGACYQDLGDMDVVAYEKSDKKDLKRKESALKNYEKATDEFRRVVQKRRSDTADPFRFHAYFLLAQTFRKMGELDPTKDYLNYAIKEVNNLIEQLPEDFIFEEAADDRTRESQITLKKALLEKAEAFFLVAKSQQGKPRQDNVDKGLKAVTDVIKAGGPVSRPATEVRNKWAKTLGFKETRSAIDLIAMAKEKFDEGDKLFADPSTRAKSLGVFQSAINRYQEVIMAADPTEEAPMIGESWQQIGLAYFKQNLYYEAALALSRVPEVIPQDPRAPNIAFASTQLFGHVLDNEHCDEVLLQNGQNIRGKISGEAADAVRIKVPGEKEEMSVPREDVKRIKKNLPLDHMMDIYVSSLKRFARRFPDDKRATEAVFRSADALRAGGRFQDAAELYETIPSYAPQYEKAAYLSGQCYWAAYLAAVAADASKVKEAAPLWQRAVEKLTGYLKWAHEQPQISPEHTRLKRYWMAKSNLRLANIYSYETVGEYEKALAALDGFETSYFSELTEQSKVFHQEAVDLQNKQKQLLAAIEEAKKNKKDTRDLESNLQFVNIELEEKVGTLKEIGGMPVEINTYRINSYAGLGRLEEAKAEYAKLEKTQIGAIEKSKLSRVLAMGYLAAVENLKKKGAAEAEMVKAKDEAAKFVLNVPSLDPNLSATDLVWYGARLFELDHEDDAAKVFGTALAKLKDAGQSYTPQYWDVVTRIANAYEQAQKWKEAMDWEEVLLAWEKVLTLCCHKPEIAKVCFEDKAKVQDLLQIWEDRENRGAWLVSMLLGDATYEGAMKTFKDEAARAKALAEWDKKETRDQAFARLDVKPFDPLRIGISPELRQRLAFATEKSGKFKEALALWQSLATDIQQGTPVWLEAKYHEVLCLLTLSKEDEAKATMSSLLIAYPKLGAPDKPELEQTFLAMMKEKFSAKNYEDLINVREDALNPSKVEADVKKEDQKAIESYKTDQKKKEKK